MRFAESKVLLGITALAVTLAFGVPSAEAVTVNKCASGKSKCVIKKVKALLGCHSKAEGKGVPVDPICIQKAEDKFDGGADPTKGCFEKLEAKPPCLTNNDTAAIEAKVDAFVLDVVQELDPGFPAPVLNKCSAGKKKNVAGKAAGKLGCVAKAQGKGGVIDPACLAKAETKFSSAWAKLELKPPCLTTGDAAALEAKVDAFVLDVQTEIDGTAGPTCGDGDIDPGEFCDPGNPNAAGAACGSDFTCVACNCACPTEVEFSGNAANPNSILDSGWTGIAHRAPIISHGDVTVNLSCAASVRPCGVCAISGPIENADAGAGQLHTQRCTNDTSIKCTTDAPCIGGGGTCEFNFGGPLALAAGGVTTCVVNHFAAGVVGTANVESGESANTALLTSRVYNGLAIDNPCPRCTDPGGFNDTATGGGTCDGGPRVGLGCDANGDFPGRPDFGRTSLDCPPNPAAIIATLAIDLSNATDNVVRTLTASNPTCTGAAGNRCLCDTCNNAGAQSCDDNTDCPDPAGPIGPICGGRRCLSGPNNGAACTNNSECPSGACARPGEPTKPSACLDDTSVVNTVHECSDNFGGDPVDQEGVCELGPLTQSCSVASGHAQRGCTGDVDCGGGGGSCEANNRRCFLTGGGATNDGTDTLIAAGMEDAPELDTSNPTLGAVFCVAPTGLAAVNNVAGLPGPARVTINGTAVGHP